MQTLFPPEPSPNAGQGRSDQDTPWPAIKQRLQEAIAPEAYKAWIAPLEAHAVSPSEIVVSLPNLVFYQGIHDEYLTHIEHCKTLLGFDHVLIRFEVEGGDIAPDLTRTRNGGQSMGAQGVFDSGTPHHAGGNIAEQRGASFNKAGFNDSMDGPLGGSASSGAPRQQALQHPEAAFPGRGPDPQHGGFSRSLSSESPHLNRTYTFDSFVKGDSNQFAVATCMSAAENPGKSYNPLFIYGATGLGKTHLLHAVGNTVLTQNPGAVVTYITSERFMNEMIYCLRFEKMYEFRQKYRNCDVLLVDDIQFISGKKATQEEFFHTFNTLYAAKKQIVITSDLFPKDIPDIEDRLRNRFQWGLIADIQPPSVEHRIAILLNKAESFGICLDYEVAGYIAKHVKRNVRELEGALKRIDAFAKLQGEPISMDLAMRTFKDMLGDPPKRLTVETVQKTVADYFKLRIADLKSKRRQQAIAYPRQIAMYLARKLVNSSYPDIGEKFGGKDHTTVMHNVRTITARLDKDLDLRAHIEALERQLEQLQ